MQDSPTKLLSNQVRSRKEAFLQGLLPTQRFLTRGGGGGGEKGAEERRMLFEMTVGRQVVAPLFNWTCVRSLSADKLEKILNILLLNHFRYLLF